MGMSTKQSQTGSSVRRPTTNATKISADSVSPTPKASAEPGMKPTTSAKALIQIATRPDGEGLSESAAELMFSELQKPLIASDGYQYENLTQRLLGKPSTCYRNSQVRRYRRAGYGEKAVQAYYKAYDASYEAGDSYHVSDLLGRQAAYLTGDFFACESRRD